MPSPSPFVVRAIEDFKREGWALFENRLPADLVAKLRDEYMKALGEKAKRFRIAPAHMTGGDERLKQNDNVLMDFRPEGANHDLNRWNMHLPSRMPFLDPRMIADPEMMDVLEGLLGRNFVLVALVSDAAFPNSGFQNIHQDDSLFRITINVPLVDITEANGPTEIWPRTHRSQPESADGAWSPDQYVVDENEMKRRRELPSILACARAGSFLLRDHRTMHRGTPNRSTEPRPMLTLNYSADPGRVPFPLATDGIGRLALSLREWSRKPSSKYAARAAGAGHTINRINEFLASSDRDYRRVIPRAEWTTLTARAQHILRYAAVEGTVTRRAEEASLRPTARLLAHTAQTMVSVARGR